MCNDMLKKELFRLQDEYKNVLKIANEKIFVSNSVSIIDEINIFWYKNKKLVDCILRNMCSPFSAYIFTGATFLDVNDNEHYPFVSLGDYHFLDDPICIYSEIIGETENSEFDIVMKKQIKLAIEDNIKILEDYSKIIIILPIRFFGKGSLELICKASEQVFLSMFKEKISLDEYYNYSSFQAIIDALLPGIEKRIMFSEVDDISISLNEILQLFKKSNVLPFDKSMSDSELFHFIISGYFVQALNILFMAAEYQMVPYVRYSLAFNYLLKLSSNFTGNQEISGLIFKSAVANVLYNVFDKTKVKEVDFLNYYDKIRESDFSNKIFKELSSKQISFSNPRINEVKEIIVNHLNEIFEEVK